MCLYVRFLWMMYLVHVSVFRVMFLSPTVRLVSILIPPKCIFNLILVIGFMAVTALTVWHVRWKPRIDLSMKLYQCISVDNDDQLTRVQWWVSWLQPVLNLRAPCWTASSICGELAVIFLLTGRTTRAHKLDMDTFWGGNGWKNCWNSFFGLKTE